MFDADAMSAALLDLEDEQRALDARKIELLRLWDASKAWAADGSATAAARLARDAKLAGATARHRLRITRTLTRMPVTSAAAAELGWPKVTVLANAVNPRTEAAYAAHEELLVERARVLSVDQLTMFMAHWRRIVDVDGANADADSRHRGQYVQLSTSFDGCGFLRGRLDAEATEIVRAVLDAISEELYRSERTERKHAEARGEAPAPLLTAAHRNALALVEMARRAAAATIAEESGASVVPARPLVQVTVDVETGIDIDPLDYVEDEPVCDCRIPDDAVVEDAPPKRAQDPFAAAVDESVTATMQREWQLRARFGDGVPLSPEDAARLACDAAVVRVVTKDGSVPLLLGRTVREPSDAQRRALASIWATCAFPGCDRRFAWCQLHHVHWWEAGGPTNVDQLLPLCTAHHRRIHTGHIRMRRRHGRWHFERADGTAIGAANPTVTEILTALRDLAA
jgi:hypothetical protein